MLAPISQSLAIDLPAAEHSISSRRAPGCQSDNLAGGRHHVRSTGEHLRTN